MIDYRRKILLVDDSKTYQSMFRAMLDPDDCELIVASDGSEALDLIARSYIDFICSSFYLRDMDAIDLCQRVRQLTKFASKPFVLLTSVDGPDALKAALPAGVTDIFHKNDVVQLLSFIKRFPSMHTRISGRLLYVEDSASQRQFLRAVLEQRGLTVDAFTSIEEAWPHFLAQDYDLVLTDVVVDGSMSGLGFVNLIRRQTGSKGDTPILALTAFDDKTRRIQLFNLGVTDYLIKPVSQEELFVRLRSMLAMRKIHLENDVRRDQRHIADLSLSEGRFHALFTNLSAGMALHELVRSADGRAVDYRILAVNPAYTVHVGLSAEAVTNKLASEIYGAVSAPFLDHYSSVVDTGNPVEFETYYEPLGRYFHVRVYATHEQCFATIFEDITERRQSDESTRIMATVFSNSNEAIVIADEENRILTVNAAFTRLTGYDAEDVVGHDPRILSAGNTAQETYREMWRDLREHGGWQGELWDRRKNGEIFPKWLSISVVRDASGNILNYIGSFVDITERKASEEKVRHLAHHDALTGLPNRFSLQERLAQALSFARRNRKSLALMLIDLDNFKIINDSLGHQMGDKLLVQVAQRLQQAVRASDIVARLGGDEFVVVLPDMDAAADAVHVAEKILASVAQPYPTEGHELRTSPSIGICLYPEDANECDDLMKKADVAMYHAKAQGRRNYQFFTAEMQLVALQRIAIENELRIALNEQQFELHYQPQLDLRSGQISGVEALVRWHHPIKGMVPPADFIPIAEESGLIIPLGDWVLREACSQLVAWQSRGIKGVRMSVNLSAHQFIDPHLPQRIMQILAESGLSAQYLDLEVTESMSMRTPGETASMMDALTLHGMSLSIDDFGTGYSSLAYLKLFPISTLKIDRSFVSDIETDPSDAQICDVTVLLAHKLNLETVAEGVETEGQLKYLLSIGCEKIQGYLISRPLPAAAAEAFILANPHRKGLGTVDLWSE